MSVAAEVVAVTFLTPVAVVVVVVTQASTAAAPRSLSQPVAVAAAVLA